METNTKDFVKLKKKISELNSHKLFEEGENFTHRELKIFMEYHVYAVWDFMSIVKALQNAICPSRYPWMPSKYTKNGIAHLINEIVFSEESDVDENGNYFSHFDLYLCAMNDVGADSSKILKFVKNFDRQGESLTEPPKESFEFIENTFNCIKSKKLPNIAAIFTYGRETTIPEMFSKILNKIDKNDKKYTNLRLYINRHIEVDSSRHGPLVATIISVLILGIVLDKVIIFSICLICFGIIFLSLLDKSIQNQKTVRYSLLTGLCIGLYSIIDGYGARLSPSAISFISWSFIINAILYPLVIKLIKEKDIFTRIKEKGKNIFFIGGTLDYLTYVIVVWSFTKAPIPMVGALRETSILFTMLIGYFFLKEKITAIKIFSILMILSGVIALKLL